MTGTGRHRSAQEAHPADARIVAAARVVLARREYTSLTTASVAEESSLPAILVRGRFPTRRHLAAGLIRTMLPPDMRRPSPARGRAALSELEAWLMRVDQVSRAGGISLLQLLVASDGDDELAQLLDATVQGPLARWLHDILEGQCDSRAIDALFLTVWGSMLARTLSASPAPSLLHLLETVRHSVFDSHLVPSTASAISRAAREPLAA